MIKIIVTGAAGRMGIEVIKAAQVSNDIQVIAGIEIGNSESVGKKIESISISENIMNVIEDGDCVVDFTNRSATIDTLNRIKEFKKPFVTGTTGFTESEMDEILSISRDLPIVLAPNMSIGVNHLYRLLTSSLRALSEYDIEIIETHHKAKKDSPSGTAKAIARIVKNILPEKKLIYGREGMLGERKGDEVCLHSVRGGDVFGEHRVLFLGNGEFLELRHFATSRRCFAVGALRAVRFIISKPPGLYNMDTVLTE